MQKKEETGVYYPKSLNDWRFWLEKNHVLKQNVWLVFKTKASGKKTVTWSESVDVALCYGWIDSKKVKIDEETSHQFFSKRKAKSTWSKINKEKVNQLIKNGLMKPAGLACIEIAKQNGSWSILDDAEELIVPEDLKQQFKTNPDAEAFYLSLSKSNKKMILQWIAMAKRPETREKRIAEIVECTGKGQKPKHLP
jgi:uncharacterized protein YdeI (YjbR/CyaY-like superfamily)